MSSQSSTVVPWSSTSASLRPGQVHESSFRDLVTPCSEMAKIQFFLSESLFTHNAFDMNLGNSQYEMWGLLWFQVCDYMQDHLLQECDGRWCSLSSLLYQLEDNPARRQIRIHCDGDLAGWQFISVEWENLKPFSKCLPADLQLTFLDPGPAGFAPLSSHPPTGQEKTSPVFILIHIPSTYQPDKPRWDSF